MPEAFFSIIIPTRNRSQLAELALRTVIEQDFDSLQVIVSDNSPSPGERQRLRDLIATLSDSRVRLVEAPRAMRMGEHWEWALQFATGRYVFYLCDDDGFIPDIFRDLHEELSSSEWEVVKVPSMVYQDRSYADQELANTLSFTPRTGDLRVIRSRDVLVSAVGHSQDLLAPVPQATFVSRDLYKSMLSRYGTVFPDTPAPDRSCAYMLLACVPLLRYVDRNCHIFGVTDRSIGANAAQYRNETVQEFLEESGGVELVLSPIKIMTIGSALAESFLRAQQIVAPALDGISLRVPNIYRESLVHLQVLSSNGVDVSGDLAYLEGVRKSFSSAQRAQLSLRSLRVKLSESVAGPPLRFARSHLTRRSLRPWARGEANTVVRVRGDERGFSNIAECARLVPAILDELGWREGRSRSGIRAGVADRRVPRRDRAC